MKLILKTTWLRMGRTDNNTCSFPLSTWSVRYPLCVAVHFLCLQRYLFIYAPNLKPFLYTLCRGSISVLTTLCACLKAFYLFTHKLSTDTTSMYWQQCKRSFTKAAFLVFEVHSILSRFCEEAVRHERIVRVNVKEIFANKTASAE